jgi:metal-responsive CopG/Arc/MetJ family transcriptional regulator
MKPKRGPGRPRKADAINRPVTVALSENLVAKLDAWREGKGINRSTAIRRFVEQGLRKGKR